MMQKEDNLTTWFFMFLLFMSVIALGSASWKFEEKCSNACAPASFITPLYELQHTCFCDEGSGRWRRETIGNN